MASGVSRVRLLMVVLAAVVGGASSPAAGERSFRLEGGEPPSRMRVDTAVELPVKLSNTGTKTWAGDRPINLSYHWLDTEGRVVERDGARTPLPASVRPGQSVEVEARLQAPRTWGAFLLQWDVVEEGVCWFSDVMAREPPTYPVDVLAPPEAYGFEAVAAEHPRIVIGAGTRTFRVILRNAGESTWATSDPIRLSYHWRTVGGDELAVEGRRSEIGRCVEPGAIVEVAARVDPPRGWGLYRFQWDVVYEHLVWFSANAEHAGSHDQLVLVLPGVPTLIALLLVLLGVAGLIARRLRKTAAKWFREAAPLADLAWLVVALAVKQRFVLMELPRTDVVTAEWAVVSCIVLVPLLLVWVPQRVRPWVAWMAGVGASVVFLADALCFRFYGSLFSVAMLQAAHQTGTVTGSIVSLLRWRDLWLVIDLPFALVLAWWVARRRSALRARRVAAGVCALLLIPGVSWVWQAAHEEVGADVQRYSSAQVAERVGLVGFHLVDLWEQGQALLWGVSIDREQQRRALEYVESRRPLRAPGPYFGIARGADLVMIQVESLQSLVVGFEIDGQKVTPNLDRLCDQGVLFQRCVDQTAFGRSSDAELISQASLLPAEHGAAAFRHARNDLVGLADVLGEHGYTTVSAVAFEPAFWNRVIMHARYGFGTQWFQEQFQPGRMIGWGLNDRDFLEQMAERLGRVPRPYAALLITLSLHHPFEGFPPELRELELGPLESTPVGGYLHAMHYFDSALGGFVARLESQGRLEETLLVLWGDHDAGFEVEPWTRRETAVEEQRLAADVFGFPPSDFGLDREDRVPLLIRMPGGRQPRGVVNEPVGLVDVAPTVAALLGVDARPLPWLGRNLAVPVDHQVVVRPQGGWIDDRHLWIGVGPPKCFQWRSGEQVASDDCRAGLEAAERRREVSELILEGDLQGSFRETLSEAR